jgi:hypothetical protein
MDVDIDMDLDTEVDMDLDPDMDTNMDRNTETDINIETNNNLNTDTQHNEKEEQTSKFLERKWIQILQSKTNGLNSDIPGGRKTRFHEVVGQPTFIDNMEDICFDAFDHMDKLGTKNLTERVGIEHQHKSRQYLTKIRRLNTIISHPDVTDKTTALEVALSKHHQHKALHRMYHIVEQCHVFPITQENQEHIRIAIDKNITAKWNKNHAHNPTIITNLLPVYEHALWDKLNMQKVFDSVELRQFLPHNMRKVKLWKIKFQHKTSKTLGQVFINNKDMANGKLGNFEALQALACSSTCSCPTNIHTSTKEHLATSNFLQLTSYHPRFKNIIPLLQMGPKYRPRMMGGRNMQEIMDHIQEIVGDRIIWWTERLCDILANDAHKHYFEDPTQHNTAEDRIKECINQYGLALKEAFTRPLTKLATETSAYHPDTLVVDENILKDIKILKKHYLFTPVDKLATSFAVICNVKAAKDIIDDLLSNNIYRIVPIETDVLVERLRAEMRTRFELSTHSRNTVIPQYIGTWKAHSSKFRFICTANRSPLKTVYQHCTKIFRVLMPKIKALWDKTFIDLPQELKPFFPILKNAEEYIGRISDFNRIPPQQRLNDMLTQLTTRFFPEIHSFDFDRLYTGIPLDDLEAQISKLLEDLWAFAGTTRYRNQTLGPTQPSNALILKITGETCKWVPYNIVSMHLKQYTGGSGQFGIIQRKGEMLFDIQAIKELFSYSVRNTYLRFGDKVFEQIIGIPMGANHCVYVANLYLFQYEHDFFKQLIQVRRNTSPGTPGQLLASQLLHAYHYIGRFVDDKINMTDSPELFLNFLNKEHQEHGILGIYPAHLGFKVTSSPSKTSNDFLNLHLHIVPHYLGPKVLTGIFRKDSTFFKGNVHPTRMPSFHSVLPAIYKFNVLHSQVVTYARLCNNHQTFTLAVSELMEHFHVQAYPMRTMWKKLGKSLRRIPKLYGCVDTSIFRRIYAMYHKVVK